MSDDKTVPFFKVSKDDRNKALENMRTYTGGDKSRLTPDMVVTSFKALIGSPGSKITAVPRVINGPLGPTIRIRIKDSPHPAFTSLAQLRSFV